jgi:AraC-like DNA-binding protein
LQRNHVFHSHDFVELVVIQGGNGEHLVKGRRQPLSMGDVIVIPRGVRHGYDKVRLLKVMNIMFDDALLTGAQGDLIGLPGYRALFSRRRKGDLSDSPVRYVLSALDPAEIGHLEKIAGRLRAELEGLRPGYQTLCLALLTELVVFLSRKEFKQDLSGDDGSLDGALDFMERNYGRRISLAELAKACGCAPRTFQRLFRKSTGQSPFEHLLNVRLRHARQLLERGVCGLSEIAVRTGFGDNAYFGRQFKRLFGMSPGAYGRDLRRKGL